MKSIFVDIEECDLEFFLFTDEVDDKMKKKLKTLGFPSLWVQYPTNANDHFTDLGNGVYQAEGFPCSSVSITEPTSEASFSINYREDRNSITLKLKGTFFSINDPEIYNDDGEMWMLDQTEGIVEMITLNNDKGKSIKKPKDEWGMSTRIEAIAVDTDYNSKGYKLTFKIHTKNGMYRDGEMITG